MDAIERFPKAKKELSALLEQAGQDDDVLAIILLKFEVGLARRGG